MRHELRSPQSAVAPTRGFTPFATLRRFAIAREAPTSQERCELCSIALAPQHRHLLEVAHRKILCACDACALRFQAITDGRFKLIPRDAFALPDSQLDDATWEGLALPINLAFFFFHSPSNKMTALYPSPAGATESLLPLASWQQFAADIPALHDMEPDVEALLVNRVRTTRAYYIVPIDLCFELVGLIRAHWRGFSGGEAVWGEIDGFFQRLNQCAQPLASRRSAHA
ncbi:MAG TPA: DUF5947 family protein [Terrimicrobiaceae bacterium]|nr:DUF5947 family protein [Terrimicrobiaceae bacterium]